MKKGLIVFALVLLLTVGAVAGYEIYMNTREYTIDDLNGIWTCELDSGQHYVLYIHDGRMDLMRYERKDESDARGMDRYRAMVMDTVPEGTFNKISWRGNFDLERTGSQNSVHGLYDGDGYEFEFKRGRIYQRGFILGGEVKYVRGTEAEHPHIVKMSKALDQAYQLSLSQKPLEIGELHCYSIVGAAKDGYYDSFLCIRITNPNSFHIDWAYATLRWEGYPKGIGVTLNSIPAGSTGVYVGWMSCKEMFGVGNITDPAECSLEIDNYSISTEHNTNPVVEVTGSRVIKDDSTGKVKTIEVDTRLADPEGKYASYDLRAIFYKQGEIIGVATGYGETGDTDQPDVMADVSDIGEYDNYEIIVVNKYLPPIRVH